MVAVIYKTKEGETKNYNEAKAVGIEKVEYRPIEEDYKTQAVNALIKARRRAMTLKWYPM